MLSFSDRIIPVAYLRKSQQLNLLCPFKAIVKKLGPHKSANERCPNRWACSMITLVPWLALKLNWDFAGATFRPTMIPQ